MAGPMAIVHNASQFINAQDTLRGSTARARPSRWSDFREKQSRPHLAILVFEGRRLRCWQSEQARHLTFGESEWRLRPKIYVRHNLPADGRDGASPAISALAQPT